MGPESWVHPGHVEGHEGSARGMGPGTIGIRFVMLTGIVATEASLGEAPPFDFFR
jgi:hypothetical protein